MNDVENRVDRRTVDSHRRSIVKALCWRCSGSIVTGLLGGIITGSGRMAVGLGIADFIVKIGVYYVHERMWQRIHWGVIDVEQVDRGGGI